MYTSPYWHLHNIQWQLLGTLNREVFLMTMSMLQHPQIIVQVESVATCIQITTSQCYKLNIYTSVSLWPIQ